MNLEQLQQKLLAAARANPSSERVPYAFEKRILARLLESPTFDFSALWAQALWRAAAPCVALALLLSVWSLIGTGSNVATDNEELSRDFEQTMLAAVDETEEVW